MKFPIYRVEFDLYVAGEEEPIQCRQDMMLREKFADHAAAHETLERLAHNLAVALEVDEEIVAWDGFIVFDRMDTWCLHYDSHYTYRTFAWPSLAITEFAEYRRRHLDEVMDVDVRKMHVCPCGVCSGLNRTMILHEGKDECPTCFSVS